MNARLVRLTSGVTLTNVNGTYLPLPFLAIFTLVAFVSGRTGVVFGAVLTAAMLCGLIAANALAEMTTRPLSWCMPGQTRLATPAILLPAVVICLLGAALIVARPLEGSAMPVALQFLATFLWALVAYLGTVLALVLLRDTMLMSLVTISVFCAVGLGGRGAGGTIWLDVALVLTGMPAAALGLALLVVGLTFRLLGSRRLARRLCGAPYVPLKAFDNPTRIDEYRSRVRTLAFNADTIAKDYGSMPGAELLYRVARSISGSSLDYAIHEIRLPGTRSDFLGRLLYLAFALVLVSLAFVDFRPEDPIPRLVLYVAIVFVIFAPGFKPRTSPLLPVSRRQHFRSLLLKGVLIYLLTIATLLLLKTLAAALGALLPLGGNSVASGLAGLRVSSMLFLAASVPIYLWGFTTFRSAVGFLLFALCYFNVSILSARAAHAAFVALPYGTMLLVSAAAFLPFVGIAFKRCLRDDLLAP